MPGVLNIVYEDDIYSPWILIAKKQYCYRTLQPDGLPGSKIGSKGVLLARRDNCPWIKAGYTSILNEAFAGLSSAALEAQLLERLLCLFYRTLQPERDRIDYAQFVISKTVKDFVVGDVGGMIGGYKMKKEATAEALAKRGCRTEEEFYLQQMPAHAQLAKRCCDRGMLIVKGQRVPFLITDEDNFKETEARRLEHYEFFIDHADLITLDRISYARKLCSAADTLMTTIDGHDRRRIKTVCNDGQVTEGFARYPCHCRTVVQSAQDMQTDASEEAALVLSNLAPDSALFDSFAPVAVKRQCIWCRNSQFHDLQQFQSRGTRILKQFQRHKKVTMELLSLFSPTLVEGRAKLPASVLGLCLSRELKPILSPAVRRSNQAARLQAKEGKSTTASSGPRKPLAAVPPAPRALKRKGETSLAEPCSKQAALCNQEPAEPKVYFSHVPGLDLSGQTVTVWTDGACRSNGKPDAAAGIGVWWGEGSPLNVSARLTGRQTNNRAEMTAVIVAIRQALEHGAAGVTVKTDSMFVINSATSWLEGWKQRRWMTAGGTPVSNVEEVRELDQLMRQIKVNWIHVKGHAGIEGNERADQLASAGALLPL